MLIKARHRESDNLNDQLLPAQDITGIINMGAEEHSSIHTCKIHEFSKVTITASLNESSNIKETNDLVFQNPFELTLGLSKSSIINIIEKGLYSIGKSDKFDICCKKVGSENEWIQTQWECEDSPDTQLLKFSVNLILVEPGKSISQLTTYEKLQRARMLKELGTALFKSGNVSLAFSKYKRALQYLILIEKYVAGDCPEQHEDFDTLKMQCYLNLAACQSSHCSWNHVIANCSKALGIADDNVKALYRRARAYEQKKEYDLAVDDLERALVLEPSNSVIQKYLANVKQRVRTQHAALADGLSKMFSKRSSCN